jgi:hypothetical protein
MALGSLVGALIPMSIVPQHIATVPEWVGRALYTADFLFLGTMFYGLQRPKPIYWKLIPVLMVIFLLSVLISTLWSAFRLSLPLLPFMILVVFMFVGLLVFIAWWRKQKNYFESPQRDTNP